MLDLGAHHFETTTTATMNTSRKLDLIGGETDSWRNGDRCDFNIAVTESPAKRQPFIFQNDNAFKTKVPKGLNGTHRFVSKILQHILEEYPNCKTFPTIQIQHPPLD